MATPGITFGDGYFYISWIGHDDHLNIASSNDAQTWSNKLTLDEKSTSTGVVALTYGNGTLFLDWSGTDHRHYLNLLTIKIATPDGTFPQGQKTTLEDEAQK